jgi:fatty-acyl-CoA synthase
MSVSESDLIVHCQREITERAAVPRAVRIIEAMPLTAVGKIFKPALRLDAVRHCVRSVTAQLPGADAVDVEVRDAGGAITVVLRLADEGMTGVVDDMRCELERYTFRVEVESAAGH